MADIDYLKSDKIGKILSMGLAEVYRKNPKYPIDYFAKWLLNHEEQEKECLKEIQKIKEREEKLEKIRLRKEEEEREREKEKQLAEKKLKEEKEQEEMVANHEYHEELLTGGFGEYLQTHCGLAGVYIGVLDHPMKECDINLEDGQDAHLDKTKAKVIQYIGTSANHTFLKNQVLQQDQGITFRVFGDKPQEEQNDNQEEDKDKQQESDNLMQTKEYIYVENVVENSQMHYHRIPKLGGYMALPLVYQSSLTEESFDQALVERERFTRRKEEAQKEKDEKEVEYQEKLKEMEDNGEDPQEHEASWAAQLKEWEDIAEEPVATLQRQFVVCCDTLGHDTGISTQHRDWLVHMVTLFQDSWTRNEKLFLQKDIDRQTAYLKEVDNVQEQIEAFRNEEEQAAEEKQNTLDQELNEKQQLYEVEHAKWERVVGQLEQENVKGWIGQLSHFRVVKYQPVIQGVLLFLGYSKPDINLGNTNQLDWKKVSLILQDNSQFLDKLFGYDYKGAKPGQVHPYAKLNRLQQRMSQFQQEDIDSYNLGLGRVFRWMTMTLALRKLDIELRRELKVRMDQEREEKIKAEEERQQQKEQAFQEHKASLMADDLEAFNEEEWRLNFDEDFPVIQIPNVMQLDEDNDLDVLE